MSPHVSIERMHEALDGVLSAAEMADLEAHVDRCDPCRQEYARLSEVVVAVRALPRAGSAPDEVWGGILARIESDGGRSNDGSGASAEEATVLPLHARGRRGTEGSPVVGSGTPGAGSGAAVRRFSLSVTQLAAAAAVVAVLSSSAVFYALGGGVSSEGGGSSGQAALLPVEGPAIGGAAARAVSVEEERYGEMIDQFEQILAEGRELLAPETLITIEQSLQTVDEAIAEVEDALALDPNSDLLLRLRSTHQRTKLGVLQRAAAAVSAQT